MIGTTIESLKSSEFAEAAELLSRAFLTDPMAQALLRDKSYSAEKILARVFRLMLDVLYDVHQRWNENSCRDANGCTRQMSTCGKTDGPSNS